MDKGLDRLDIFTQIDAHLLAFCPIHKQLVVALCKIRMVTIYLINNKYN